MERDGLRETERERERKKEKKKRRKGKKRRISNFLILSFRICSPFNVVFLYNFNFNFHLPRPVPNPVPVPRKDPSGFTGESGFGG